MHIRTQTILITAAGAAAVALAFAAASQAAAPEEGARYTADGRMEFPKDYRSWAYLSTGMDMSYVEPAGATADSHFFDTVFVNRASWAAFQKTGTWPDKTVMVLEVRKAADKGSINKRGHFQTDRLVMEVHIKDQARFKDTNGWAFFTFGDGQDPGQRLPAQAGCVACHEAHGAVDSTFVQFYPTLLPIAHEKKTLSANYLKDEAAAR